MTILEHLKYIKKNPKSSNIDLLIDWFQTMKTSESGNKTTKGMMWVLLNTDIETGWLKKIKKSEKNT